MVPCALSWCQPFGNALIFLIIFDTMFDEASHV